MASVAAIRAQLASDLTGISSLDTAFGSYRVSPVPVAVPVPPQIEVAEFGIQKHQAMTNGAEWWTVLVRAYLALSTADISFESADAFLADDPISAAIEADETLGGLVADVIVDRVDQRSWTHPQVSGGLIGAEWQLRILV